GLVLLLRPVRDRLVLAVRTAAAGAALLARRLLGRVLVLLALRDAGRARLAPLAQDRDVVARSDRHVDRPGLVLLLRPVRDRLVLRRVRALALARLLAGGVLVLLALGDAGRAGLAPPAEHGGVVAGEHGDVQCPRLVLLAGGVRDALVLRAAAEDRAPGEGRRSGQRSEQSARRDQH